MPSPPRSRVISLKSQMRQPRVQVMEEAYSPFEDNTHRTRGDGVVHLTDIIKALESRDYSGNKWDMPLTADCGFIWEVALERAYKERLGIRPGEIEVDGIICSPDGFADDPLGKVDLVDSEYKLTWKSSRNQITDNWYYMTQFKGYCHVLQTNVVLARVLYVCGDYRGSGPQYVVYRIEYDPKEIKENWENMVGYARGAGWL